MMCELRTIYPKAARGAWVIRARCYISREMNLLAWHDAKHYPCHEANM
jgi:hypothetical protein